MSKNQVIRARVSGLLTSRDQFWSKRVFPKKEKKTAFQPQLSEVILFFNNNKIKHQGSIDITVE